MNWSCCSIDCSFSWQSYPKQKGGGCNTPSHKAPRSWIPWLLHDFPWQSATASVTSNLPVCRSVNVNAVCFPLHSGWRSSYCFKKKKKKKVWTKLRTSVGCVAQSLLGLCIPHTQAWTHQSYSSFLKSRIFQRFQSRRNPVRNTFKIETGSHGGWTWESCNCSLVIQMYCN